MQNTSGPASDQHSAPSLPLFCAIVGPTASGKTEVSIAMAEILGCDILCADAMQIYRGLDIGTAKPTSVERNRVVHHGLDLVSPLENFSASRYASYAEPLLETAVRQNQPLVLCGGTGLYYRALLEGFFMAPDPDPELRRELNMRIEHEGNPALHTELARLDPETAAAIHPNDARRITRALEIIRQTNQSVTVLRQGQQKKKWLRQTVFIGIRRERDDLADRIERRTRWIYRNGLIDETRFLIHLGCPKGNTALQALGYKECFDYCHGKMPLENAVERTIQVTKWYAKRQMTWFRRQFSTHWLEMAPQNEFKQIVNESLQVWQNSGNNIGSGI